MLRPWLVVSLVTLLTAIPSFSAQEAPSVSTRVIGMTAKLFYSGSGTFSENILNNPDFALWNTIIGEGSAKEPSNATLLLVELSGDGNPNVVHRETLTITTHFKGKALATQRNSSLAFSKDGKHYEAVWLADTGCLPVTITAAVGKTAPMRKTIDFECGE